MGDACATDMKMIIYCQPIVLGQNKYAEKQKPYILRTGFFFSHVYICGAKTTPSQYNVFFQVI